jgi:phosphatidylserine/phosphatidylglycerophosphate/cardiolipin synthase-like enzyme
MTRSLSLLVAVLFLTSCTVTSNVVRENGAGLEVYFCPEDMCQEKLLDLIDSSSEIKCAFYDLNLPDVMEKLKAKGAEVVVEDSTEIPGFITYPSADLMHNKFCVFDKAIVFTGSMNPTENDNFYNNNNILIIRSGALAQNYLLEFDELNEGMNGKGARVRNPLVEIDGILIENYFCPEDNCKLRLISALKAANTSIRFMIFTFADKDVANLLYNKDYLGLDVKGVIEKRQSGKYSQYEVLKGFTILDDNPHTMHHKVFIIDGEVVVTGSYNPTARGTEGNDENMVIIHDRAIAQQYLEEFESVYDQSVTIPQEATLLQITRINNNPEGKDEGNEFFELRNLGTQELDLEYFSVSDNKSSMRLFNVLGPGKTAIFTPKFALKNKDGVLILRHNDKVIDLAVWGPVWDLFPEEGEMLVRTGNSLSKHDWSIVPS